MNDDDLYLKCPDCGAPCFPSRSGLWKGGVIEPCPGCGARLMVGMSATGCAEAKLAAPEVQP